MTRIFMLALAGFFSLLPIASVNASDLVNWHSTNVQLLYGTGYKFAEDTQQTTVTFEHMNDWKYGDNFIFVDNFIGHPEGATGEFSPRLSLGKMTGEDFSFGPVKDVLISATWEKARRFDAYLIGGGIDLDVPGFDYLQANLYSRNNPDAAGHGWQTTWVWGTSFNALGQDFRFDGYFDYADYEEGTKNFYTQPQLLVDLASLLGVEGGKAYAGVEWLYWHNKFGIDGVTDSVPQAMVKYVF